ncbi:MAG: DegT/DnrJ/EryC1/StrS family aminotransferase [Acidobacteriota bacterium]|mgnify:CR=1 FL=1
MKVPFVNLKPALEATAPQWRARLDELFTRMHFILGEQVAAFEREFATYLGARFAVGVGSGTSALELCLRDLGAAGREVITSPLTAPFTGLAILAAGATPRFADVEPDSLLLSPEDTGNRINKRTAALVPVHLYGKPCELRRFAALGCPLVQDACQAHGARYQGRPLAAFSPYVCYSFYPTKNLGCLGDGGAVVTNRASCARRLALLRDGGRAGGHVSRLPGINSRLDEMQACYLRAFLPRLDEWNAHRARIASLYDEALRDCPEVRLLKRAGSVHHLYVIRVARRERLREHLAGHGIGAAVHYPVPLHLQPAFRDCGLKRGALPVAEKACREILSLPLWPYMPEAAAEEVVARIRSFYR